MSNYYKVVAENRKARHDYSIIETVTAGIILTGNEIKSIRSGRVNLKDCFGRPENGVIWLYNMHITPYEKGSYTNLEPTRKRKLLLKKGEIRKLIGRVAEKGLSLIPLKLFFKGNWAKIDLAVAKPKKTYQKKETLKKKDIDREVERTLKEK